MGIENGRRGEKIGVVEPNEIERSMHQLFAHELGEMAAGQRTEFSAITTNGLFHELTGFTLTVDASAAQQESSSHPALYSESADLETTTATAEKKPTLELSAGMPDDWSAGDISLLAKIIGAAKPDLDDPKKLSNLGGGLPPPELIREFFQHVFIPTIEHIAANSEQFLHRAAEGLQYPTRSGGTERLRLGLIDHFIPIPARNKILENFVRPAEGLFVVNGSQEALGLVGDYLVTQEKATPEQPAVLVVTEPIYPGMLLALEPQLRLGLIKLRVVPTNKDGLAIDQLTKALQDPKCKAIYLSEGNPVPGKLNYAAIAEAIKAAGHKVMVFQDMAYKDLGASEMEESLFTQLDSGVVVFETTSKKGAPGSRMGLVYSNETAENFAKFRQSFLNPAYNRSLGYSGMADLTWQAILAREAEVARLGQPTPLETHVQKCQEYYERRRQLYVQTMTETLRLVLNKEDITADDLNQEATIGDARFMFVWRNTGVDALEYSKIAAQELALLMLPGVACRAEKAFLIDPTEANDEVLKWARQNYTWLDEINLKLGVYKDALLKVALTMADEEKRTSTMRRLEEKITELNGGEPRPEVASFMGKIDQIRASFLAKQLLPEA